MNIIFAFSLGLTCTAVGFYLGNRWAKSRFFYVGKKKKNITQDVLVEWNEEKSKR